MRLGLRGKLFLLSLLLIAGVGLVTLLFFESRLRDDLEARAERELEQRVRAGIVAASVADTSSSARLDALADALGTSTESQVTIFGHDGAVLGDSTRSGDDLAGGSDADMPEVRAALADGRGVDRRRIGDADMLFVAVRFPNDARAGGVLRMGMALDDSEYAVNDVRTLLILAALVGLVVAVFLSAVASELMARALRRMVDTAVENATGAAPRTLEEEDEQPNSQSFKVIAEDLHEAVGDLAEERDRLETILECMHDAVLALDADGRIAITNTAAERLLAMDDDDVGRPLLEAVRAPALAELAERSQGGESVTAEFEMVAPTHRHVLAHAAPLRTEGGVVIVMHDVTELRRLERVRRDFVANVSHELRTPISVIRANAETLLGGALKDKKRAPTFVDGIHRSAERLSHLIGDLLDLSRIEAGQYSTQIREVPVRSTVDAVVDGLVARANERAVAVLNEVGADAAVMADSTGLSQILQNLLDNAIKYAPASGHVWVRAMPSNDVMRIEVQDDGPGIEPHHRKRVFERFYRVDPGRSRQIGGTGLGLSIVKHLAEQMGGKVGVDPAPDRGSLFWVELPIAG